MAFQGETYAGVTPNVPAETQGFTFNHTMLRIKDPERSLAFYTGVMGMRVLRRLDFAEMNFSLYFLARLNDDEKPPEDVGERTQWTFSRRAVLELTHNWGSEDDPDVRYHDGNQAPQGFGHICFSVPDLERAVEWLDHYSVTFVKRPQEGKMRNVAFIRDPDGYWIEIIQASRLRDLGNN